MKQAIVTGGSGVIGQGLCRALKDAGYRVANFDRVACADDRADRFITCDLSQESAVLAAFEALGWEHLDLLVNNGGQTGKITLELGKTSLGDWDETIGSHLTGAFLMSRAALPLLRKGSSIVMMASTRALMSEGGDFAYAAAKGGLIGLTQALAIQLGPNIRVNAIAPGWITNATDLSDADHHQHPVGRVGCPDDIAKAVLYLADAGFVTGQTITVDGGMTKKMIYEE